MKSSDQIKPISYLKAHSAEVVRNLSKNMLPMLITQNNETKSVVQEIKNHGRIQEAMTLLKRLALGQRQINEGNW